MTTNDAKQNFIKEFSDNYAELFVSVFIIKYGYDNNDTLYNDLHKCLMETSRKIKKLALEETKFTVNEKGD